MLALFSQLVDRLVNHAAELEDDRRRDVRHDAEGEDRELGERPAGEHVEKAQQAARLLGDVLMHGVAINAWNTDEHPDPIDREHPEGEDHTAPELRDLVKVTDSRESRCHGLFR